MSKGSSQKEHKNELTEEMWRFFEFHGKKALEIARRAVLEDVHGIESNDVREAMQYFIRDYWHDLARPTLLSVCCESVGGDPAKTTPFAVSLTILSGGIDIHDDIIDGSKRKHGKVTVYGKFGKNIALLVGDALLFKGFTLLHEACTATQKAKAKKIIETVKGLFYELGDAEALEFKLRDCWKVEPKEYLHVIKKKAADVEAHARIGAIIGNASSAEEKNLAKYGQLLGMIIIIRDDIADLLDKQEFKHRIRKEHLPLPLIYALEEKHNLILQLSTEELFNKFNREISTGIKQARILIRKIQNEAIGHIKGFKTKESLEKMLKAFSIIQ